MPLKDKEAYKAYMKDYMLKRWHKRRHTAIEKLGGLCVHCGTTDNLQFDHIDPALKSFSVSKWSSASEKKWQAEIEKCQLLCEMCHIEKSRHEISAMKRKVGASGG